MDCIHVSNIRCYGYIGYLPEEKILGQWFTVDLSLWLDLSVSGQSDNINDTFNYCEAIDRVKTIVSSNKFDLIEKLATAIADDLLNLENQPHQRPALQKVGVRVIKSPPIPDFGGQVTIDITRENPKFA
ncbi:dihydroneopterin aldolase [Roseofilum capinflatum]|uniref:7,8-dihydroneopterin aldolase n=1 Tax=Roseofilum capinflatum BLCC-M114 TaxID=3022440 RepID=A0ABT7B1V2_9CYAN|nr:dihydroneopterin aldolase [Roseofilum capinflatum]MDJ1172521.1 dihydroneopterin aldolase [Roseofilum capinflatum BLCC-M114]